ncbi:MAG: hypothetical protein JWQ19_200 [Subtercola sp.]|nr:hypothetical protein [Subtercola sp.]
MFANGGAAPVGYLADTPFGSYLIPGLILGIIVGGTQLAGAVSLQTMRAQSLLWCAVGGFGMMVWIFVELRWPVKVNVSSHQWMNGTRVRGSKDAVLLA